MAKTSNNKPVMLGTRISPKAQYGLRLLARVQGRTIGEAVEWAINLALRQTRVGGGEEETRLSVLVDAVWRQESVARQVWYLHDTAPELLDFEDRAAWNLVQRCDELITARYWRMEWHQDDEASAPIQHQTTADDPEREPSLDSKEYDFEKIDQHWEAIKRVGNELAKAGEIEMRFTLDEIISGEALKKAGLV